MLAFFPKKETTLKEEGHKDNCCIYKQQVRRKKKLKLFRFSWSLYSEDQNVYQHMITNTACTCLYSLRYIYIV